MDNKLLIGHSSEIGGGYRPGNDEKWTIQNKKEDEAYPTTYYRCSGSLITKKGSHKNNLLENVKLGDWECLKNSA